MRQLTFKSFSRDRNHLLIYKPRDLSPLMHVAFDNYRVIFCLAGEDFYSKQADTSSQFLKLHGNELVCLSEDHSFLPNWYVYICLTFWSIASDRKRCSLDATPELHVQFSQRTDIVHEVRGLNVGHEG